MDLELATTADLVAELFSRFEIACFAGRKGRAKAETNGGDGLLTTHTDVLGLKGDGTQEVVDVIDGLHGHAFDRLKESPSEDDE